MQYDYAFEMTTSSIRFGAGVSQEVGMDLADMGVKRAMVVTDPTVASLPAVKTVLESLSQSRIAYILFDKVRIEPTDASMKEAIEFAKSEPIDGFVAVGGGSSIDTCKVANPCSTYVKRDLLDYVNPPLGRGLPVAGRVKPVVAIPTTAGTGSETTGVATFDLEEERTKTGISSRFLVPTLALVDPLNARTMPSQVAACTGMDVLTAAAESYTTIPFSSRPRPERPSLRPAYQGSNPISDIWSLYALQMVSRYLIRSVEDPNDHEARSMMMLVASYARIGTGNAGVSIPHAMSYPVASMVRDYHPEGYPTDRPLVPHGMAVTLGAPAAFSFTGTACPERHLRVAEALGADISKTKLKDAGRMVANTIIDFIRQLDFPRGLRAIGYSSKDIPPLVEATLLQHRLLRLSPRSVGRSELTHIFEDAMEYE